MAIDSVSIFWVVQVRAVLAGLLVSLALAGCATTSPFGGGDVAAAAQQNSLEGLFIDVDQALQRARPGSERHASLTLVRNDLAHRLSADHLARIDKLLASAGAGSLPMPDLAALDAEIATIEPWQPEQAEVFAVQAGELREITEGDIADLLATLDALAPRQVGERYTAAIRLAHLEGGADGERRRVQANIELAQTYDQGLLALQENQLPEASALFDEVAYAEPDYRDVAHYRDLVATGLFEQHFWQALVERGPDDAYAVFHDFVPTPAFSAQLSQVALDVSDLAQYYEAQGDTASREGRWLDSYRAYQQASFLRNSLQLPFSPSAGLTRFLQEMERRYRAADRRGQQAAAMAYLSVIESSYPQHGLLGDNKRTLKSAMAERASVKLLVDRFAGDHGGDISAALHEELGASTSRQFQLVSGEQPLQGDRQLLTYVLRGEAYQASVRRRYDERPVTKNVRVGSSLGPNPAYMAWKKLPKRERAKLTEPPREANLPVYEYVTLSYTDVTSLAELNADFQLRDLDSGVVALQDTVAATSMAEGTGVAPLTQGAFSQSAITADIPADSAQTLALADEVAVTITARLSDRFLALDQFYVDRAKALAANNEPAAAVDAWALAVAVSDPGTDRHAELRTALEEAVLSL